MCEWPVKTWRVVTTSNHCKPTQWLRLKTDDTKCWRGCEAAASHVLLEPLSKTRTVCQAQQDQLGGCTRFTRR